MAKLNSSGLTFQQTKTGRFVPLKPVPRYYSGIAQPRGAQNYLGHSINAPTGRWQKNKDVHWYVRDEDETASERQEELRKIKEAEAEALAAALYVFPLCESLF